LTPMKRCAYAALCSAIPIPHCICTAALYVGKRACLCICVPESAAAMSRHLLTVFSLCCVASACAALLPTDLGDDQLSALSCVFSACELTPCVFYLRRCAARTRHLHLPSSSYPRARIGPSASLHPSWTCASYYQYHPPSPLLFFFPLRVPNIIFSECIHFLPSLMLLHCA
jgi:hypothetical protein